MACKKTRAAVKVLLYSVFVPLLLICLVTQPMRAEIIFAILNCDAERAPKVFRITTGLLYSFLAQMELACITALAIVRAVAVWSPWRHKMKLYVSLSIVMSIFIYSFLTTMGILGSLWMGYVRAERIKRALVIVYFSINTMLPFFVTAIAYALMMFAIRRNWRRLAIYESRIKTTSFLDQPTRATMAVFTSNLVFGLPHTVYHLLDKPSHTLELSFHMLFYTHFVVDPVVFIWYNSNHRKYVLDRAYAGWQMVFGCYKLPSHTNSFQKTSSVLQMWISSSSTDQESHGSVNLKTIHLAGVVLTESEV